MLQPTNDDFSRFVGSLLPEAVKSTSATGIHRALVAFHAGTLLGFVKRSCQKRAGALEEGTLAWVLPVAIEPLQAASTLEVESSKESLVSEVIVSDNIVLRLPYQSFICTALELSPPFRLGTYLPSVIQGTIRCLESNSLMCLEGVSETSRADFG